MEPRNVRRSGFGGDLVDQFVLRHTGDMSDGVMYQLQKDLNTVRSYMSLREEGASGAARQRFAVTLESLIKRKVLPIIERTLKDVMRRKNAQGGVDRVPSSTYDTSN